MANAAIVAAGSPAGGISVFNAGPSATDVIIDMNGYFAPPSGGLDFYPVAPCRLVDTRGAATGFNGIAPFSGPSIPDGGTFNDSRAIHHRNHQAGGAVDLCLALAGRLSTAFRRDFERSGRFNRGQRGHRSSGIALRRHQRV